MDERKRKNLIKGLNENINERRNIRIKDKIKE